MTFGGLAGFLSLLRRRGNLRSIVRRGDAVGDDGRDNVDNAFDGALPLAEIAALPRSVLAELAGILKAEGSRTKAAIGASNYGLSLKVSSDGDITVYVGGQELIRV